MKDLTATCLSELGKALKLFGTYNFDDKGSHEVMELPDLVKQFRALPADEAAAVILELAESKEYDGRGERLASDLLGCMEDWDELFEVEGILNIY